MCFVILFSGLISASITDVANAANTTNSTVVNLTSPTGSSSTVAVAPLNPAYIAYINNKSIVPNIIGAKGLGLIPPSIDFSHLSPISTQASFPAAYDLRTLNINKVTPVKDQNPAGTCWVFATYGSLESYLMPTQQWSFSENNMKNVLSSDAPQGFDRGPNDGGNSLYSTAYLARWSGPVSTSDDPYSGTSVYSPAELGMPIQKHVQNVSFIPFRQNSTDNNLIKSALQTYGAVDVAMYYDPSYFNTATNNYYDYLLELSSNHEVTIVGWDDNYDKNKFIIVPPGNGAFIVKNSWGTTYGENGYFYVSYYDLTFAAINPYGCNAVFTAENTNNYKNIYQYDPLGWTDSLGTGSTPTFWGANVFTATSNDPLKAVSFYTTDSNCNYNLYVGSSILTSRTLVQSGTIPMAGYHTIPLNSAIPLTTGQKFSVIVNLTTPNYNYPIALEEPLQYKGSNKAIANASESFYSSNGNTWYDMTSFLTNTNICIKAFTGSATLPIPTVTALNPKSGSAAGGNSVIITGTGFTGVSAVKFGTNPATTYTVNSATQITATAPAGTGTVDVTVTTTGGTSATSS